MYLKKVFILASVLLLSACGMPFTVSSDHQAGTDFTQLKTYQWREANQFHVDSVKYLDNDIIDGRIKSAVNAGFTQRGISLAEDGKPDFLVSYSVTTTEKADIRNYNSYGGMAPGFSYGAAYGRGYHYGAVGLGVQSETKVIYYKEGTFVLDVVSVETDKLIWRASADGRLNKKKSPAERMEAMNEVVGKMLENFPPSAQ